ncbi:L-seryl-tRNA(Sec) selenium transferase [Roseiterribacter gracilis]|uniref:L-seryl-tRNA(Sec) selenium transferase n=1 Tax=Roseiterribacter gracilis TaxID=2812848 RepID=A0A8S8XBJ4_9PROT|nr:L-seryl-tRNA(Sec) selenium transferase [Rhodospirillales bacterium TMPK1]
MNEMLRHLPSVDQLLRDAGALIEQHGRLRTKEAVRAALDAARAGKSGATSDALLQQAASLLDREAQPSLRPVFNLTGTVLHTNLGRALLAAEAIEAANIAMRQAVTLEFNVDGGHRGERDDHLRGLLLELTGAEDATVVNNNAAAVLLVLNSLGLGKQAIVSRGELIEIGGSFRMPDIMSRAGVELVEVGTTNRTHAKDYAAAITDRTGLILKVHTSNYRIEGFTAEMAAPDLARLAQERGVPLVNDLGSGSLVDLSVYGLAKEPTVREAVAEGADIITFSGDKLLGGPQAGFIIGKRELIAQINRNPMKRALRVDKIRLAALEATLRLYRDPDRLAARLPTLRALARPAAEIEAQAQRLRPLVQSFFGDVLTVTVVPCQSQVGSGALPTSTISSAALSLRPASSDGRLVERLAMGFRNLHTPIVGRIEDGALLFDLRCLEDDTSLLAALTPHLHEIF